MKDILDGNPSELPTAPDDPSGLLNRLQSDPTFGSYFQSLSLSTAPVGALPPAGFDFPIFTDPADCAFQLIEGKKPRTHLHGSHLQPAPADAEVEAGLGPFSVFMSGSIDVNIGLSIGYDTNGLRTYLADPKKLASDLLDGFYIDNGIDPATGYQRSGITVEGNIKVGAGALGVILAGVIHGTATLTIGAPGSDTTPGTERSTSAAFSLLTRGTSS